MNDEQLSELEALANAATPGPWGEVAESGEWWLSGPDIYDDAVMSTNDTEISQADVDFIAAARTDVPALVAEVRRLQELEHLLERKTGAFTGAMLIAHQELDQLRAALAAATQRAEVAQRLLESLTPGGSEFYDSPNNCAEWATRRMNEVAKIAKERNELRARAEAAEAALAAVPEAAIMRTLFTGYRSGEQYTADADAINAWAAQRGEAHPRGAPTAVFEADDFEVDEGEAQP